MSSLRHSIRSITSSPISTSLDERRRCILGFDVAGIVVGLGRAVTRFAVGDAVFGMIATNQDGAWAAGGVGGYALVREYAAAPKPEALSFTDAGVLGVCFLSACLALLADHMRPGDIVYILGGGGGVGHLAIQKARAIGVRTTTRRVETKSPVAGILAEKGASLINVNLIRTFTEPGALDDKAKALLSRGLEDAATSATAGTVRPHISATVPSEVDAINAALAKMKAGEGGLGKIAVIVDTARAG